MFRSRCFTLALAAALSLPLLGAGPVRLDPEIDKALRAAKAGAHSIPEQAQALARLAWPDQPPQDERVAHAARDQLVRFGHHGLRALRETIRRVPAVWTADVTAALIEARWRRVAGDPPEYLPALVDAVWYGSPHAQRLAITELARFNFPPAVLPIIDAARAHPELTGPTITALSKIGDPRSRFFIAGLLTDGNPRYRARAAAALTAFGDEGLALLREAAASPDDSVRRAAIDALLPLTTTDDLTMLHEYPETHAGEEPGRLQRIRDRAAELELEYERKLTEESASGGS